MQQNPFEYLENRIASLETQLASQPTPNPTPAKPEANVLDIDSLITYLGNVSKATVYRWLHMRCIPSYKLGKRVYFQRSEIDDWMKAKRRRTIAEVVDNVRTKP